MDDHRSRRSMGNRARERQMVRERRKETLNVLTGSGAIKEKLSSISFPSARRQAGAQRFNLMARDALWYVTHTPQLLFGLIAVAVLIFLIFIGSHVFSGRIFPNIWALGVAVGDLTVDEAAAELTRLWDTNTRIKLVDGERQWSATPAELGLILDAQKTAEAARTVGLAGIPMGYGVQPVVSVDYLTAQSFLLDLTQSTDIAPQNATYAWQADSLQGVPGTDGRMMDVPNTVEALLDNTVVMVENRRIDLVMETLPPDVSDPEDYLDEARAFVNVPLTLNGYDPFLDQTISWSTNQQVLTSWLEAGETGLTLRESAFAPFFEAQTSSLTPAPDGTIRYLDPKETKDKIRESIQTLSSTIDLRIRYREWTYTVERGDTAYRISRKTGIPFYLFTETNPGVNLDVLSPGDTLNLPSKDRALPLDPVGYKRIVVDLDNQSLAAFENGQVVFRWLISSGMSSAPTSPGIYQILNRDEVASGGSYTLCNADGLDCGQWEMYWFMGMYEVVPGLMNGFHGAVLLPNGAYLGGGNVGAPYTFGCVMSENSNAERLFQWAEVGTVVEIISSEYPPQSELAKMVKSGQI